MQVSAIISEFNPFHYGHKYLIDNIRSKGTTHIVAVMSGNFVQRGEPAIFSKWVRARMALLNGVDLVIEIPTPWSISTAEKFSYAGVQIADSLGCIDYLDFASECGEIEELYKISSALLSQEISPLILKYLSVGLTYAKAREGAIRDLLGEELSQIIKSPNNILGIEYLKSINKLNSNIIPRAIKRVGTAHDSNELIGSIDCASSIRKRIYDNDFEFLDFIPDNIKDIIINEINLCKAPASIKIAERTFLYKLRLMNLYEISNLPDISEGMENRIFNAIKKSTSIDDIYFNIKTKRYTLSRIRRIILSAILGIDSSYTQNDVPYIKVLGFNKNGKEILKHAKKRSKLKILTKRSDIDGMDIKAKNLYELECRCTDIYNLMLPKTGSMGEEMMSKIVIL